LQLFDVSGPDSFCYTYMMVVMVVVLKTMLAFVIQWLNLSKFI